CNQFASTQIDRFQDFAFLDRQNAFKTIINVHETTSSRAVAPDLDFMSARKFRLNHFTTDGGGRFFPPTVIRPKRTIDIVETRYASLKSEILAKMAAHTLAKEFFPSITIFGHSGVSVFFAKRNDIRRLLLVSVIHTG